MPETTLLASHWVHDLDPVILHLGGAFAIRWYGLAYLAGFVGAYLIMRQAHRRGRSPLAAPQLETLFTALFFGVLVGGRLGYMLLYDFGAWREDPLRLLRLWEGGMASHGGFLGVACAGFWAARHLRVAPGIIADLVVITAPLGLFFGRIANFINGELWGKVSDVPWAVIFPQSALLACLWSGSHPATPPNSMKLLWRVFSSSGSCNGSTGVEIPAPLCLGAWPGSSSCSTRWFGSWAKLSASPMPASSSASAGELSTP